MDDPIVVIGVVLETCNLDKVINPPFDACRDRGNRAGRNPWARRCTCLAVFDGKGIVAAGGWLGLPENFYLIRRATQRSVAELQVGSMVDKISATQHQAASKARIKALEKVDCNHGRHDGGALKNP